MHARLVVRAGSGTTLPQVHACMRGWLYAGENTGVAHRRRQQLEAEGRRPPLPGQQRDGCGEVPPGAVAGHGERVRAAPQLPRMLVRLRRPCQILPMWPSRPAGMQRCCCGEACPPLVIHQGTSVISGSCDHSPCSGGAHPLCCGVAVLQAGRKGFLRSTPV